jgi:hypothetical protein
LWSQDIYTLVAIASLPWSYFRYATDKLYGHGSVPSTYHSGYTTTHDKLFDILITNENAAFRWIPLNSTPRNV